MEYEQQQPNQEDSFLNKIKESPRTVSAIIIILIVAAAIYAFSGNKQDNNDQVAEQPTATPTAETSTTPTPDDKGATATPAKQAEVKATVTPAAPVDKSSLTEASKGLPAGKTTDSAYIETAVKGDGLTHLARRAATRYLADHEAGYTLTNEHRIYIEDYIRKHMEKRPVSVGMEQTISFDLVKQAVESAGKLSPTQLKNLTKYTSALK